jgi:hypothetical protein
MGIDWFQFDVVVSASGRKINTLNFIFSAFTLH